MPENWRFNCRRAFVSRLGRRVFVETRFLVTMEADTQGNPFSAGRACAHPMQPDSVEFVPEALQRLRSLRASEEQGGLLFGSADGRLDVTMMANRALNRVDEFRADALEAAMAAKMRTPLGTWQSHVDGDATPSLLDRTAAWPDGLLVIASKQGVTAWRRLGDDLTPLRIRPPGPVPPL